MVITFGYQRLGTGVGLIVIVTSGSQKADAVGLVVFFFGIIRSYGIVCLGYQVHGCWLAVVMSSYRVDDGVGISSYLVCFFLRKTSLRNIRLGYRRDGCCVVVVISCWEGRQC